MFYESRVVDTDLASPVLSTPRVVDTDLVSPVFSTPCVVDSDLLSPVFSTPRVVDTDPLSHVFYMFFITDFVIQAFYVSRVIYVYLPKVYMYPFPSCVLNIPSCFGAF